MGLLNWLENLDRRLGLVGGPSIEDQLAPTLPTSWEAFALLSRIPTIGASAGPLGLFEILFDALVAARSRIGPEDTLWAIEGNELTIHRIRGIRRSRLGRVELTCRLDEVRVGPAMYWRTPDPFGVRVELCNGGKGKFRAFSQSQRAFELLEILRSRTRPINV